MRANLVTRNVLKIKRYAQRLTKRACMGEGGSYLWAPVETCQTMAATMEGYSHKAQAFNWTHIALRHRNVREC